MRHSETLLSSDLQPLFAEHFVVDRRTFIKLGGAALAAPVLISSRAMAAEPKFGKIAYQLGWVKNFQFAGEYIADHNKLFEQEGIAVDLLAGGPSVSAEPIVISGKALVGQNSTDNTANAVAKGALLKIIGTNYQKSPLVDHLALQEQSEAAQGSRRQDGRHPRRTIKWSGTPSQDQRH